MLLDADYERSPLDNIKDGISRELEYFAVNGDISYRHNGEKFDCTFDDVLSQKHQSLRLRTAISHGGTYYHYLHELGVKTFRNVQKDQKNAGLLVIADDKIGAENCANHLSNKFGLEVKVLTEETPNPTETLRRFNDGEADALVAVQMMTEGVNSPRLRVGVYLTRKTDFPVSRMSVKKVLVFG